MIKYIIIIEIGIYIRDLLHVVTNNNLQANDFNFLYK